MSKLAMLAAKAPRTTGRSVTLECHHGNYEVVIRIPVHIELDEGAIIVKQCDLPDFHVTFREKRIMELLCAGKQNKEIGAEVGLSERTVKFHVSNLLEKARCSNRVELALKYGQQIQGGGE